MLSYSWPQILAVSIAGTQQEGRGPRTPCVGKRVWYGVYTVVFHHLVLRQTTTPLRYLAVNCSGNERYNSRIAAETSPNYRRISLLVSGGARNHGNTQKWRRFQRKMLISMHVPVPSTDPLPTSYMRQGVSKSQRNASICTNQFSLCELQCSKSRQIWFLLAHRKLLLFLISSA